MKKEKRKGTSTGGQTKKTGRKKKVHEKTSTHIGVGYFMYLAFRSMYFFFSHKYMKKYTDFRTSITALKDFDDKTALLLLYKNKNNRGIQAQGYAHHMNMLTVVQVGISLRATPHIK